MRPLSLAPLALALCLAPVVRAAEEKVKFDTVDYAELHGTFYSSTKNKNAPTVLMLHKIGGTSQLDGWDKLAQELNKKGCAVLAFDFRGHGESTSVDPDLFWKFNHNLNGATVRPSTTKPKDTIAIKDFKSTYYPYLVNDIAAAKMFLDRKNDAGECNSGNLILLGAEDGATLGLMWMTAETHRYQVLPSLGFGGPKPADKAECKDYSCGVWLSISQTLGTKRVNLTQLARTVGNTNKVPMGFVYATGKQGEQQLAQDCINAIKPDKVKNPFTVAAGVKNATLGGHKLLNEKLDTLSMLGNYVEKFLKENNANDWDRREVDKNSYVWRTAVQMVPAKLEKEKSLQLVPLAQLNILQ